MARGELLASVSGKAPARFRSHSSKSSQLRRAHGVSTSRLAAFTDMMCARNDVPLPQLLSRPYQLAAALLALMSCSSTARGCQLRALPRT